MKDACTECLHLPSPVDPIDTILSGYRWLEREDLQACREYARRVVARERIEPF